MSDSETDSSQTVDLPDLVRLVQTHWKTIAVVALVFLIVAVIGTTMKQPAYEATAFLELSDPSEIATIEEKLRFPSLYRGISEGEEASRDLARRTRIRSRRGSRLIGVTVRHSEPATAATEADAVVEAFLSIQREAIEVQATEYQREFMAGLYERIAAIDAIPSSEAADSPEVLAETWRSQKAELEKLKERYADEHLTVTGARERLEKLRERTRKQFVELREQLELPVGEFDRSTFEDQIDTMVAETIATRKSRAALQARINQLETEESRAEKEPNLEPYHLAERAAPPLEPAGLRPIIVWLGALVLGSFAGFLLVLCRKY